MQTLKFELILRWQPLHIASDCIEFLEGVLRQSKVRTRMLSWRSHLKFFPIIIIISQLERNFCTEISAKITRKTLTSPGIDAETSTRVTLYYRPIPFTPPQNFPSARLGVSRVKGSRSLRVAIDSADTIIPKWIYGKVRFRRGTPK